MSKLDTVDSYSNPAPSLGRRLIPRTDFFSKLRRYGEFLLQRMSGPIAVSATLHFDVLGQSFFLEKLSQARFYLEYGSGGSTVQAAYNRKDFVSVEGDRHFHAAVKEKIGPLSPSQKLLYADIGPVGFWSKPLFTEATPDRVKKWESYAEMPWRNLTETPDLVLVDGRFRVACALTSLQHLEGKSALLLVDDYVGRPYYRIIEEFADLVNVYGRMAVFAPRPHNPFHLARTLKEYQLDWR